MRIEYDAKLIEQAVFLAARRDPARERALHAQVDPLYALEPSAAREDQFRGAYAELFQRMGLDAVLPPLLREPILGDRIEQVIELCLVREAARRREELAELLVRPTAGAPAPADRTLVVQLVPGSLLDSQMLAPFLRRELLHVADILDPEFSYERESLEGGTPQHNLVRDRYRVLWDIYVEGRLLRAGLPGRGAMPRFCEQFTRAFTRAGVAPRLEDFERLISTEKLTHAELLAWAMNPLDLNATLRTPHAKWGASRTTASESSYCQAALERSQEG